MQESLESIMLRWIFFLIFLVALGFTLNYLQQVRPRWEVGSEFKEPHVLIGLAAGGQYVITEKGFRWYSWELSTGQCGGAAIHPPPITPPSVREHLCIPCAPLNSDSVIHIFNLEAKKNNHLEVKLQQGGSCFPLEVSSDGGILAVSQNGINNRHLILINRWSGEILHSTNSFAELIGFSNGGKLCLYFQLRQNETEVFLWNTLSQKVETILKGFQEPFYLTPDGSKLLSGIAGDKDNCSIGVFNLEEGKNQIQLKTSFSLGGGQLFFSSDSRYIARSHLGNKGIEVWDLKTGQLLPTARPMRHKS
jgi:WD40 repeat protein